MCYDMLLTQTAAAPLPWYWAGLIIAGVMVGMLFLGRALGVSSNLRTMCAIGGAGRFCSFFNFDWRRESWNLTFIAGAMLAGVLTAWFNNFEPVPEALAPETRAALAGLGFRLEHGGLLPPEWFSLEGPGAGLRALLLLVGGLMVGFGTRWAGGCTSGHAIMGLSNLQLPSLLAVIGFFAGGLLLTHVLLPIIAPLING